MIDSPPHSICSHYDISPRRKGVIDLAEGIESISNNSLKTVAFVTVARCDGDSRNDPVDKDLPGAMLTPMMGDLEDVSSQVRCRQGVEQAVLICMIGVPGQQKVRVPKR